MIKSLQNIWWILLIRAIFAILIGILAISWPGQTLVIFITLFGIFSIVEGALSTFLGLISIGENKNWWITLIEGLIGLIIGWIIFAHPGTATLSLLFIAQIFAIWIVLIGIMRIIFAVVIRNEINNEWLLIISGIISILFGLLVFSQPLSGILALIWIFSFSSILSGILLLSFSFKIKAGFKKLK